MKHIDAAMWQVLRENRLGADEMLTLMEHLDECPDCQARYLQAVTPRLEELADLFMAEDFTAQTMQELREPQVLAPTSVGSKPLSRPVVKSRLSPALLFQQRLVAYAVAASLTMALMIGGAFAKVSSLPGLHLEAPSQTIETDNRLPVQRSEALGPLLPQNRFIPGAQQPFRLPPLRQLIERSIVHGSKK